ncbi:hypothetical protein E3P99_00165 [Wallemia hederae]|uniref:Sec39 domain-containing protein n=1 Tax=Wallemia hederae TaxID=1540922 RepID=A0A4T0FY77_9BASI|nr:hypothetical protein E3P99_00165 [Wallemia hederae]
MDVVLSQKRLLDAIKNDGQEIAQLARSIDDGAWLKSLALSVVHCPLEIQSAVVEEAIAKAGGDEELLERRYRLETFKLIASLGTAQEDDDDDDPWKDDESAGAAEEQQAEIDLARFLILPIRQTALELAAKGEITRLITVIGRYPDILSHDQYQVLDAIPITIPPTEYLSLLPSDETASGWYTNRAMRMDSVGRQLDNALLLIQHGAARGVANLDRLGEDLTLVQRMAEYNHSVGLLEFQQMSYEESVEAYLVDCTPSDFADRIQKALLPYLFVLESRSERQTGVTDTEMHERLLAEIVLASELDKVLSLIEASRPDLGMNTRVLKDDKLLVAIAVAVLYTTQRSDVIDTIQRIFECMPAWEGGASCKVRDFIEPSTKASLEAVQKLKMLDISQLGSLLDRLDIHIESLEILARWDIHLTLSKLELSDYDQQLTWARTLTRRSVGTLGERIESGSEWEALLDDMVKLSNNDDGRAFGLLDRDLVIRIFFSGLLNSAKFELARELLSSPDSALSSLDKSVVNEIVLETSQEFMDNATDGNLSHGYMRMSKDVLEVGDQASQEISDRRQFVFATSKLCSYNLVNVQGVHITPLEIRLESDKMVFIDQLLNTRRDGYRHADKILALAEGMDSTLRSNVKRQVEVLGKIVDAAIKYEDYEQAYLITQSDDFQQKLTFSDKEEDKRWLSFYKLGVESRWTSLTHRAACLAQAMRLCPEQNLHGVLSQWKSLEASEEKSTSLDIDQGKEIDATKDASDASLIVWWSESIEECFSNLVAAIISVTVAISAAISDAFTVASTSADIQLGIGGEADARSGMADRNLRAFHSTRRRYDVDANAEDKELIPSTHPPQPPIPTPPAVDFNRDIGKADRVYHPFDTYKFVQTLQAHRFSRRISEIIMVATRTLLIQHALIARSSLMTREDLENSSYLFQAALTELRVELSIRGRADASALRSMTTALTREVDGLEQKMKEDIGGLKDDIELDMNNRKDETQSDGKAFEINVQSLNNRITVATGELRTEVERDKWDTTIRVVGVIFFEAVCIVAAVLFSDPEDLQKKKQGTRLPTAEELGIRETEDDVQQRVI